MNTGKVAVQDDLFWHVISKELVRLGWISESSSIFFMCLSKKMEKTF